MIHEFPVLPFMVFPHLVLRFKLLQIILHFIFCTVGFLFWLPPRNCRRQFCWSQAHFWRVPTHGLEKCWTTYCSRWTDSAATKRLRAVRSRCRQIAKLRTSQTRQWTQKYSNYVLHVQKIWHSVHQPQETKNYVVTSYRHETAQKCAIVEKK